MRGGHTHTRTGATQNLVVMRGVHECIGGFPAGMQLGEDFVYAQRLHLLAVHLEASVLIAGRASNPKALKP